MMRRRAMGRRGAPLLRGAVVGGAAYAAGKHVARRQQQEADQDAAIQEMQDQSYPPEPSPGQVYYPPPRPAAPAPAAPAGGDVAAQLGQLAQLHAQGALTDSEFEAAKAQLLGG
jgi:putative oligomerization/nucleic acid binding protein